ncbi:MAG: hypothetical protein HC900_07870, partial [Methylacidiphilales bacterium]|nr:hypothetical protein [Candidatus Methylacidiphilales bacterium]
GAPAPQSESAPSQRADPAPQRRLALMTVGSSILKIGLHPAATQLRRDASIVASSPKVFWVEYQALVDIINFYKCNPAQEMGLEVERLPEVRTVRIRKMLNEKTYRRFRGDFFRMHRQFVMGNERRYHYDYFMILCGPVPLEARVFSPETAMAAVSADGVVAAPGAEAVA